MTKTIELLRHTANDGDQLTPDGVAAAIEIGRSLAGRYALAASTGAQRATQTIGCLLAGMGEEVPGGVVVVAALRSQLEERWRAAYRIAGSGDLESLRAADPDLVATDSETLAAGLRHIFSLLADGGRALAVGHSPTNEAAVFGLTGVVVEPMPKGGRIVVVDHQGIVTVQ